MTWEEIDLVGSRAYGPYSVTERARVPGGWLVRATTFDRPNGQIMPVPTSASVAFVPDPDKKWSPR